MADDFEQELVARLRRGTSAPPVAVTPGPVDDPEAAIIARLRADALTTRLVTPTKENPRGQVLETPGWNMGMSVAQGMTQGLLPQIAADVRTPREYNFLRPWESSVSGNKQYEQQLEQLRAAREAYNRENPGKALVGELGGSMATAIPAMAAGAGALGIGGRAITAAAPWTEGIVNFLSGASKVPQLKAASQAVRGAVEGVEGAALSSGLSDAPLSEQLATGGGIGMVAGPIGGVLSSKYGSNVNRTTADSAQALIDQGVKIAAGDIPGANVVQKGLQKVFGTGAAPREQFTEALSKHAGYPTKEINQEWVNTAKKTEGKVMEDIQSVYKIPSRDTDLVLDLDSARLRALGKFSDPADIKKVNSFFDKLDTHAMKGIDGPIYKNIVEKDGLISNFVTGDQFRKVAGDVREIFDDAWGRHLPDGKKALWDEARKRYRVIDTIDNSMGATGAAEGVYNPKKLLAAVERKYGNVENAGELGLLARGGQFLEPPSGAPAGKHGIAKIGGTGVLIGGAFADVASGGQVHHNLMSMIGPIMQHPENYALPLAGLATLLGGAKMVHGAVNSPRATQYLLDVSRGSRDPLLHGLNPYVLAPTELYNKSRGSTNSGE